MNNLTTRLKLAKYDDFIARKNVEYGDKFSAGLLAPKFVAAFNHGERITVDIGGERKRGRVSVTTGWLPVFILILRKSDHGSMWTLSDKDTIVV